MAHFGLDYGLPIALQDLDKDVSYFVDALEQAHYRVVVNHPIRAWSVDVDTLVRRHSDPLLLTEHEVFEFYNEEPERAFEIIPFEKGTWVSIISIRDLNTPHGRLDVSNL